VFLSTLLNLSRLLLIIVSVVSTSFLIVFGFWVPYNSSLIWLTSCGIGIGFGVFIYESIFVFLQNFICRFQLVVPRRFFVHFYASSFRCTMLEESSMTFGQQLKIRGSGCTISSVRLSSGRTSGTCTNPWTEKRSRFS
jgi:hypothetical protein